MGSYIYGDTVIVTGVGSQIVKFTEPTVIPVELTSFTSSVGKAGVTLEWSVTSEINNRVIEIERKAAGVNQWVNLGYVEGKETTTSGSSYRYVDSDILRGRYNYRLKQIVFTAPQPFMNSAQRQNSQCPLISHCHRIILIRLTPQRLLISPFRRSHL